MKFGIRTPSLNKRIAARTSLKRVVRHNMGLKAPRGYGWITNPKKAAYNRVYNRTTFKADGLIIILVFGAFYILWEIIKGIVSLFDGQQQETEIAKSIPEGSEICPRCNSYMVLRNDRRGKFYGCSEYPRCYGSKDYLVPTKPSLEVPVVQLKETDIL